MNLREMKVLARGLIRDNQVLDAHFARWINAAYRDLSRQYIIPKLHSGAGVALVQYTGNTQTNQYVLPYDFERVISFYDGSGRSLDPIPSEDVMQFGEYNSFGSFVQFYEHNSTVGTPLYSSAAATVTLTLANRGTTATASSAIFLPAHVGEFLLPLAYGSANAVPNPEDYGYKITAVPTTATVTLEIPFKGALNDSGTVSDLASNYFEIRPANTPLLTIWGDPGQVQAGQTPVAVYVKYQRKPKKLANDEDIPEDNRLCEAMIHQAIALAGLAYRSDFDVKNANANQMRSLAGYQTSKDFDRLLVHNYISGNPNARTYGQGVGTRHMGMIANYDCSNIRY